MAVTAPFTSIKNIQEQYGLSHSTIYQLLSEINMCPRYKHQQVRLDKLVNVCILEDYLANRKILKRKTVASKNLPPFSMHTARVKRGDIA